MADIFFNLLLLDGVDNEDDDLGGCLDDVVDFGKLPHQYGPITNAFFYFLLQVVLNLLEYDFQIPYSLLNL